MEKEEILKILRDAGLEDDAIVELLHGIIEELAHKEEEEKPADIPAEIEETEDEKRNRIFGL